MSISASNNVNLRVQLTNNTGTGLTDPTGYRFLAGGNSTLCLDATGNTSNNGIALSQSSSGVLNVEQFSQLSALNSNTNINVESGSVTEVANGFCNF